MTIRGLIVILIGMTLVFTAYLYADYKRTGGYKENTSEYYGYRYFTDNNYFNSIIWLLLFVVNMVKTQQ